MAETILYVGTFTGHKPNGRGRSEGIYVFRLDTASGKLTPVQTVDTINPSFVALAPDRRNLYAVNAVPEIDGHPGGAVSAFAVDPADGTLRPINRQASHGAGPCHVSVDRTGRAVLTANYGGGSIAALPRLADGSLAPAASAIQHVGRAGVVGDRQDAPHAHSINLDPTQRFALVCDLGLDQVLIYRLDAATATLTPNPEQPSVALPAGAGPRHLAFHPSGAFVYVLGELGASMTTFAYNAERGALTERQTISTLPAGFAGANACADVHVHPNGKFLYGSNRFHDSIVIYAVDETTGKLTLVGHESTRGKTPRNFMIEASGALMLVANQDSDDIFAFRIDPVSGRLTLLDKVAEVPTPVCLVTG
ncbi:MAG TPA: lactonase family protein [Chloroflexota bacterium]|nr:lactonase family protein [Chloroflexota bacterium]